MKILLADDEPIARTMLEHWLTGWGYEVTPVRDGQAALDSLRADAELRLAIIDWVMPKRDGIEVCRELRKGPQEPYVYVVLLTAKDDKADIISGLDAGADDYLVKPCNPLELKVRLRAGRRVLELQEQLVQAREALRLEAMNDALTSVLNQGPLMELLAKELSRAARSGTPVSVLTAALNEFVPGDARAQDVAGAVLREMARRLESCVRAYDCVGRLRTDEFVVVLPACGASEGLLVAERVSRALSETPILTDAGPVAITTSIGVSSTDQFGASSGEALIRAATSAHRQSRDPRRSRCVLASAADFQGERSPSAVVVSNS